MLFLFQKDMQLSKVQVHAMNIAQIYYCLLQNLLQNSSRNKIAVFHIQLNRGSFYIWRICCKGRQYRIKHME